MLNILSARPNVLSVITEDVVYSVEFFSGNFFKSRVACDFFPRIFLQPDGVPSKPELPLSFYGRSCNKFVVHSGFGGLDVACWPLVPKFAGSNPAEAVGFFRAKKSSARLPSEGK